MKIISLIFVLSFLLFSCNKDLEKPKNKILEKTKIDNLEKHEKFLKEEILSNKEIKKINENEKNVLKEINNISNTDEVEELIYPEIINYEKLNIDKIDKNTLEKSILDKELFVDLEYEKDNRKLEKILKFTKELSDSGKINSFELHCYNINSFNKKELNLLKKLQIKIFKLQDICGFRKEKFSGTWYNKEKVIKFLKESKNIKELYIGNIDMDLFKKENGEIIFYQH